MGPHSSHYRSRQCLCAFLAENKLFFFSFLPYDIILRANTFLTEFPSTTNDICLKMYLK